MYHHDTTSCLIAVTGVSLLTGHNDFDIHSGESATIVPRPVASLSRQVVVAVAAAKHHTAAITAEGDLYTWGANRHCQLGYSVDTQPTPRKCVLDACACAAHLPAAQLPTAMCSVDMD